MEIDVGIPVLFSYRNTLFGVGGLFEVRMFNSRALYLEDADGGWMYGVSPGGIAAPGPSFQEAHLAFRATFSKILIDMILETESVEEYRRSVERFARETSDSYEAAWQQAVESVRRMGSNPVGLSKAPADSTFSVEIVVRQHAHVGDNVAESDAVLAA